MTDDKSGKVKITLKGVSAIAEVKRVANQFEATRLAYLNSPAMRALEEQSRRWEELMAPMMGQVAASQAAFNASVKMANIDRIAAGVMAQYSATENLANRMRLSLPETGALAQQYAELFRNPMQEDLVRISSAMKMATSTAPYQAHFDELRRIMENIHKPWVKNNSEITSFHGLAGLASIGKALRESVHPFEKMATHLLRDELGDWRHARSWSIADDPIQRADYYVQQGLNTELIDYPLGSFDEVLSATQIQPIETVPAVPKYNLSSEALLEAGDAPPHMIEAFRILFSLENSLRRFIDEVMTRQFGSDWVKHRIPSDLKESWNEKRTKGLDSNEQEHPLICYADFTDYEKIIVRKDNWNDVFKAVFRNKESVAESLRRLYPLRNPTMHSRIIIPDDMLYLRSETRRILKAIKKYG